MLCVRRVESRNFRNGIMAGNLSLVWESTLLLHIPTGWFFSFENGTGDVVPIPSLARLTNVGQDRRHLRLRR